jgi:uncharacterized protein YceH (UPF0502 family)
MNKYNGKMANESGRMLALTVASMNLLITTVLFIGIWAAYSLLEKADRLNDLWKVWTV